MKLTLYLFKPHVTEFTQCLKPASEARKYRDVTRTDRPDLTDNLRIYLVDKEPTVPSWVGFIAGYADSEALNTVNAKAASALVLAKVSTADGDRLFAASYGSGYNLIDDSQIEQGFGLKVTLNTIYPHRIKAIDYKNISSRAGARREAATAATTIANFGFEHESEVLKSAAGRSADDELGASLAGADSLKITVKDLQLAELSTIAQKAYDKFKATTYRTHFEFIDYFELERDPMKLAELDELLVQACNQASPPPGLHVALPDPAAYTDVEQFKLTVHGAQELFDQIELSALHRFVRDNSGQVDSNLLKKDAQILGLDHAEEARTPRKSVYAFLGFEITQDGVLYVLSNSKWYRFSLDFIAKLDTWLEKNLKTSNLKLKPWSSTTSEAEYAASYQDDADFYNMVRDFYQPRGHGQVQMADLYQRSTNSLIDLKKFDSAVSLPHLLSQATTSADLLRDGDERAWEFLLGRAKSKWPEATREQLETKLGYVFVFAGQAQLPQDLPVFSKIALRQAVRAIRKLGLGVTVLKLEA